MVIILFYRTKKINNARKKRQKKRTHLAMLHDVELPQPGLIERIARGMYNMTKSVLFCKDQHRVKQAFHRLSGLNESRTCIIIINKKI